MAVAPCALVGLVGFGGLFPANRRATSAPRTSRFGGFGGFRRVISSQSTCELFPGPAPALVGLVGFGGLFPANRRARCEASELLGNLRNEGFRLHLDSAGGLVVQPASALTGDHRQAIRDHRADLVELLEREAVSNFGDDRRRCTDCRHLRTDQRCAEAMRGRMAGVDRNMRPLRHVLQRCPNFKPLEEAPEGPEATA